MPVHTGKRNGKWRILEGDGSISTTSSGKPKDGGGHRSKTKADRQARAINEGVKEKGE
jgi:hypothetical protein